MQTEPFRIIEQSSAKLAQRILTLNGPLVLSAVFEFQSIVRADQSKSLILDFSSVPYADSAGIGALVGAYVTRQHSGRGLGLVSVCTRVRDALKVTRVEQFFQFFDSVGDAQQALPS